jgi:3-methyladenine DNA glycosylase AlkD
VPAATSAALAARVDSLLRPHAIPARRAFLTASYAPAQRPWLGVPVPAIRTVVRDLARATRDLPPAAVLRLALALARKGSLEARQVGYELLGRRADALALVTRAVAERLGRGNDNWVSVDAFATMVIGPAWRLGHLSDRDLLAWARATDPWWRRTALVATVALNTASRSGRGDVRRTLLICRAAAVDVTPMIARALSWALRSLAPHDPAAVLAFLGRYGHRLPAAVVRDVVTKVDTGRKRRPGDRA